MNHTAHWLWCTAVSWDGTRSFCFNPQKSTIKIKTVYSTKNHKQVKLVPTDSSQVCVYVWVRAHTTARESRSEDSHRHHLLPSTFFETRSLLLFTIADARLAGMNAISASHLASDSTRSMCLALYMFWGFELRFQLTRQVLYPLSHLPRFQKLINTYVRKFPNLKKLLQVNEKQRFI